MSIPKICECGCKSKSSEFMNVLITWGYDRWVIAFENLLTGSIHTYGLGDAKFCPFCGGRLANPEEE